MTGDLSLRPRVEADLPELHGWLQQAHVKRFYGARETYDDTVAHYLPAIQGTDPTDHYLVLLEGRPIGMLQTYLVSDHPEYATVIGLDDTGTAGMDILIGEVELTGRGLGTEIIRRFADEIVFAREGITACVAGPAQRNAASIRAFEKAGFRPVSTHLEDGEPHVLLRRDRQGAQSAPR